MADTLTPLADLAVDIGINHADLAVIASWHDHQDGDPLEDELGAWLRVYTDKHLVRHPMTQGIYWPGSDPAEGKRAAQPFDSGPPSLT